MTRLDYTPRPTIPPALAIMRMRELITECDPDTQSAINRYVERAKTIHNMGEQAALELVYHLFRYLFKGGL